MRNLWKKFPKRYFEKVLPLVRQTYWRHQSTIHGIEAEARRKLPCSRCKIAKKRCEGGSPCARCLERGYACTMEMTEDILEASLVEVPRYRSCGSCVRHHQSCDRQKPICSRCQRFNRTCTWTGIIPHRELN
jgi:hypothetical protein